MRKPKIAGVNIPPTVGARNVEEELDGTRAVIGVNEGDLTAVNDNSLAER